MANSQRFTREIPHRYRLEAQKFDNGTISLPHRLIDPETGNRNFINITLKGTGTVISYTIIHIAADAYQRYAPFPVAIIETDEGARLTAQIVDCNFDEIKIGSRVELVFRKIIEEGHSGIINYAYKAVLL